MFLDPYWILPLSFVPYGASIALLYLHVRGRRRRLAPIDRDRRTRRLPGTALRSRISVLQMDLLGYMAALPIVGAAPAILLLAQMARSEVPISRGYVVLVVCTVALSAGWLLHRLRRGLVELDNCRLGYECELAVGQELERLVAEGYDVRHDVPIVYADGSRANIDHVVVGPNGVFAVETKGRSRRSGATSRDATTLRVDSDGVRVPGGWATLLPIRQSKRQAVWLSDRLHTATKRKVWVTAVLVYPGWRVESADGFDEVVVSAGELRNVIRASTDASLDATRREGLVAALDTLDPGIGPADVLMLPEHVR